VGGGHLRLPGRGAAGEGGRGPSIWVLLASLHGDDPLPGTLERAGVPAVLVGRPAGRGGPPVNRGGPGDRRGGPPENRGAPASYVDADNRGGARQAVDHLARRGRWRIATIAGPQDMAVGQDRLDGWRDGLRAAGLVAADDLVEVGDFTEEGGAAAMGRLLQRPGRPVDAVFAASDLMAAGALRALRAAGRSPTTWPWSASRTRRWPATPSRP